jgi:Lhr-like helicase
MIVLVQTYRHVVALGQNMSDSKSEQQVNIKFFFRLKKSVPETFQWLTEAYDEDCMACPRIVEWHKWSWEGRESVKDDDCTVRSRMPVTSNIV